jgi:hypothetical protein
MSHQHQLPQYAWFKYLMPVFNLLRQSIAPVHHGNLLLRHVVLDLIPALL